MGYPGRAYRDGQRRPGGSAAPKPRRGSQDGARVVPFPRGNARKASNDNVWPGVPWVDYPDLGWTEPDKPADKRGGKTKPYSIRIGGFKPSVRRLIPGYVRGAIRLAENLGGLWSQGAEQWQHLPGWTVLNKCDWDGVRWPLNRYQVSADSTPTLSCLTLQALSASPVWGVDPIPATTRSVRVSEEYSALPRWRTRYQFARPANGTGPQPSQGIIQRYVNAPASMPYPTLDPHALPIGRPVIAPRALPRRAVNGRRLDPRQYPGRRWEATYGRIELSPSANPWGEKLAINTRSRAVAIKPAPMPSRPGPRTRELKSWMMKATGPLRAILDGLGEVEDFVDSILEGVKAADKDWMTKKWLEWKRGPMWKVYGIGDETLTFKAWMLYQAMKADIVDVPAALKGLNENELEDRAYGQQGQQLKKANQAANKPAGWGLGPAV